MPTQNDSLTEWVVGAVAAGFLSVFGWLLKWAVDQQKKSTEAHTAAVEDVRKAISQLSAALGARMDALAAVVNTHNTDVAVLRVRLEAMEQQLDRLDAQLQQVREG